MEHQDIPDRVGEKYQEFRVGSLTWPVTGQPKHICGGFKENGP